MKFMSKRFSNQGAHVRHDRYLVADISIPHQIGLAIDISFYIVSLAVFILVCLIITCHIITFLKTSNAHSFTRANRYSLHYSTLALGLDRRLVVSIGTKLQGLNLLKPLTTP